MKHLTNEITLSGETYTLIIEGKDLRAEGLHRDIVQKFGWESCRHDAIAILKDYRDDFGFTISFSESHIDEKAEELMAETFKENYELWVAIGKPVKGEFTEFEHELN